MRGFAKRVYFDTALAAGRQPLEQWLPQMLLVIDPISHDQGLVVLPPLCLAHHVVQSDQGRPFPGNDKQSRRFPIEAVRQLEKSWLRLCCPKLLYDAKRHSTASVNRDPGRLINDQDGVVLVHYWKSRRRHRSGSSRCWQAQGGNAHHIAFCQTVIGRGAPL